MSVPRPVEEQGPRPGCALLLSLSMAQFMVVLDAMCRSQHPGSGV